MGGDLAWIGSVVALTSLLVLAVDGWVNGGRDMVEATCLLFAWTGGCAGIVGLVMKLAAADRRRPDASPFSAGWRPPPRW
jgi:hypothetical protein